MTNSKITEREIYNSILNGTADQTVLCEFAERKLAQLDKRNASAAKRMAAKREAGNEITEAVYAVLGSEPMTRNQVVSAMDTDLSVAKISSRLNTLVKAGRIQKTNIKVAGADGKATNKVAYFVAE